MPEQFLHGVEVVEIDNGPRPIRTVKSSIIGVIGTAPDADATAFPLDTPVLVAGSRAAAAKLDLIGDGKGTLPAALDLIFDQIGAMVVVIRVAEGTGVDAAGTTLANVLGGVDGVTGHYRGVHALLSARTELGVVPRILCAPGFTHARTTGAVLSAVITEDGSGYTSAPVVTITGNGVGAAATATVVDGALSAITITKPGRGYTAATIAITGGGGSGATATVNLGVLGNAVVSELVGIAERTRAVIIADGPNTTDEAAVAYRGDWGSKRVFVVDPGAKVQAGADVVDGWASAAVAGLIAKTDNDRGFWWSPSNQPINGIVGMGRPVDFMLGDANCRANYLNEHEVATIIREDGFRLWGNRTCSSDPKFAFLSVVRTADMLNDSLQRAHLWAVDRNITKTYIEDVVEGVNAYIRSLVAQGALLGGNCWPDPDLNSPANISQGKVFFNFDFTPPYPAEHITFRSQLVNDYIAEIF
ncbi:phage tail sheath C-terminal domain-containing protein [Azospirillum doebereinerae]|uniref:phage tail sheath C-terminal domain-containing protein n=1 Tax=Azospirillum doebereinerae TaxID=92933 RepID=UPI001EE51155|nr:phage tail sheath C-terminal domain-containing protein [Azospirillum doebereinerae]MCG5240103.1 phage tail sheath subtilisin-like domain-containing protein [Azospirillum doebereinerae]